MGYIIGIGVLILTILFVPPIILIIGGVILLFVPGLEILEILAVIIGVIKLYLMNR